MSFVGSLLVATPSLTDPHFEHTVILVLTNGDDGSVGVVLNRRTEITVPSVLPAWTELAAPPKALFEGGPVQPDAAICVGLARTGVERAERVIVVHDNLVTVDLDSDVEATALSLRHVRVFSGYAGWSTGQLESEVEAGGWIVVPMLPADAFAADPDGLWAAVLQRQGGLMPAVVNYPPDPSLN